MPTPVHKDDAVQPGDADVQSRFEKRIVAEDKLPKALFKLIAGSYTHLGQTFVAGDSSKEKSDGDVVESAIDLEDAFPEKFKWVRGERKGLRTVGKGRAPSADVKRRARPAADHAKGAAVEADDAHPAGTVGHKGVATESDVDRPKGHGPAPKK